MQDLEVLGFQGSFFFDILLRVFRKYISHFISFTLTIIDLEVLLQIIFEPTRLA